ncbi:unnamed protein product [Trichogramma brassicae]|uniref:Uncharacterized protein n=1 Tax=Trichogramma brassicae TaxID=86971 RepID=A0A6H5IHZ8_9HYME|nr:unnamed protein product [Trichogramma brassicae]
MLELYGVVPGGVAGASSGAGSAGGQGSDHHVHHNHINNRSHQHLRQHPHHHHHHHHHHQEGGGVGVDYRIVPPPPPRRVSTLQSDQFVALEVERGEVDAGRDSINFPQKSQNETSRAHGIPCAVKCGCCGGSIYFTASREKEKRGNVHYVRIAANVIYIYRLARPTFCLLRCTFLSQVMRGRHAAAAAATLYTISLKILFCPLGTCLQLSSPELMRKVPNTAGSAAAAAVASVTPQQLLGTSGRCCPSSGIIRPYSPDIRAKIQQANGGNGGGAGGEDSSLSPAKTNQDSCCKFLFIFILKFYTRLLFSDTRMIIIRMFAFDVRHERGSQASWQMRLRDITISSSFPDAFSSLRIYGYESFLLSKNTKMVAAETVALTIFVVFVTFLVVIAAQLLYIGLLLRNDEVIIRVNIFWRNRMIRPGS